jgi:hypothetical protein
MGSNSTYSYCPFGAPETITIELRSRRRNSLFLVGQQTCISYIGGHTAPVPCDGNQLSGSWPYVPGPSETVTTYIRVLVEATVCF